MALALEGGTLIDGSGRDPLADARVVVEGERIVSVGDQRPRGAESLEVSGFTDPDRVVLVIQGGRVVKDTRSQAA